MQRVSYNELRGERTLIIGDVSTGKTRLTRRILRQARDIEEDITAIDMAPPPKEVSGNKAGGPLLNEKIGNIRYFWPKKIETPRLSAKTPEQLIVMAKHNEEILKPILEAYKTNPSSTLFVNDVSIYLQQGSLEDLWSSIAKSDTLVVNGYYGKKLKQDLGTGISRRERKLMDKLASKMDNVLRLRTIKTSIDVQVFF